MSTASIQVGRHSRAKTVPFYPIDVFAVRIKTRPQLSEDKIVHPTPDIPPVKRYYSTKLGGNPHGSGDDGLALVQWWPAAVVLQCRDDDAVLSRRIGRLI